MYENFTSPLLLPEQLLNCGAPTQDTSVIDGESHALDDIQGEATELLNEAFVFGDRNSVGQIGPHLSADTLEEYSLEMLGEAERDSVEDHLLVCQHCTEALDMADSVIALFKVVLTPATAETSAAVCH